MAVPFKGVFSKIEFPPYSHREYPKWVTTQDGKRVKIASQQEEVALALLHQSPRKNGELDPVEAERNKLAMDLAQARADLADLREQLAGLTPGEGEEPQIGAKAKPPTDTGGTAAPQKVVAQPSTAKTQGLEALSGQQGSTQPASGNKAK